MNSIWRIKGQKGAAAVVGTTAALGITVLLAALLYWGVADIGDDVQISPFGAFTKVQKSAENTVRLEFGAFVPTPMFSECKLVISPPSGDRLLSWNFTQADGRIVAVGDNSGFELQATDLGGEGKVSLGDFVTLKAAEDMERGEWSVNMIYTSTGAAIAAKTFTQ